MTEEQYRRAMRLIPAAKSGDEYACDLLTRLISKEYAYMIKPYFSIDPAYDRDDLMVQFQLGIWQAIQSVKESAGNPVYHLAWRGQRAVASMLRVVARRRENAQTLEPALQAWEIYVSPDVVEVVMDKESRMLAYVNTHEIADEADLTPRQKEALGVMLGEDIMAWGFNRLMAEHFGTSQQGAQQLRERVLSNLALSVDRNFRVTCLECTGKGKEKPIKIEQNRWVCPKHPGAEMILTPFRN
jgi:hypothetical protein